METLNSHSLMLGDWIKLPQQAPYSLATVDEINDEGCFADGWSLPNGEIQPVLLTTEILEKNGFEKKKISDYKSLFCIVSQNYDYLYVSWIGIPEFGIGSSFDEDDELQEFATIRYVHELQHALRLCGIEKEIEL